MGSVNTQSTRSTLLSVDTTLSADITATQNYIPVASTANFSTSVVAEIETTNEIVSFSDISSNLLTYSEEFNNQSRGRVTITSNDTTAPDGTTTADKITQATGETNGGYVGDTNFSYDTDTYTFSVYAKNGDCDFIRIQLNTSPNGDTVWFDISNGTVGTDTDTTTSTITDAGDGWYRCVVTTVNPTNFALVYIVNGDGTTTATPAEFCYLWGRQLEKATSTSTYLPTVASSRVGLTGVTRGVNGTTAQAASSGDSIQQLPYALGSLDMPVRLRAISVSPDGTGAARLTLCDNNGDTLCDVDIPNAKSYTLNMPEDGIIFPNGVFVSNTDNITAYTVYTEKYSGPNLTS